MKAHHATITALDFETTGAVPGHPDEPWQIGLVELTAGRVTAIRKTICALPPPPFNPYAPGPRTRNFAMPSPPRPPRRALAHLAAWLANRPLLAHNVSTERKFLQQIAPCTPSAPGLTPSRSPVASAPTSPPTPWPMYATHWT